MSTTRKSRWRHSRNSIPAQRQRRRVRRRHTKRGGTYYPMTPDVGVAKAGVHKQLLSGVVAISTALCCFILGITSTQFMILVFLGLGFIALSFGIALIASARREEKLHLLNSEPVDCIEKESNISTGEDGFV